MTAKSTKPRSETVRFEGLDDLPSAPPISAAVRAMTDEEIEFRAASDPDAGPIPHGFWAEALIGEPEGTEQITLRLPRSVLRHFKAAGKGYQSRISAVLSSYVDSMKRKKMG